MPDDFLSEVLSSAADLQLAEATVTALVRDGLVRLCRGNWETTADNAVPIEETDAVLRDWATWAIPDGPHVFLFATH